MLDAYAAVKAALNPLAAIAPTSAPSVGQSLVLDASPSDAALGAVVASYQWSIVQPSSPGASLISTTAPQTALTFPGAGSYTVRLDVTDANGRTDSQTCTINVSSVGNVPQCSGLLPASLPTDIAGVTYDPASGLVSIPSVQVGTATYIDVTLMYVGSDTFALRAAIPQVPAGAGLATYDDGTKILSIPSVKVNATTYVNVTLQNIGGYTFKLLTATAQP
jgi:PKD repeat protein